MRFAFQTQPAIFLARPNRYVVLARLLANSVIVRAHCADPGRLAELLLPGAVVHVSATAKAERKTGYDLRFVNHPENGQLVSLDTRLPNAIFWEGLQAGFFAQFRGFGTVAREVPAPLDLAHSTVQHVRNRVHSRIDFRLVDADRRTCWVEVKSATLVEERVARFPDAVTARGRRHVEELSVLAQRGDRAALVFIVQRPDADQLMPQWQRDPEFGAALAQAAASGVEIYAYTCNLTLTELTLARSIPVITTPP